MRPVDIAPEDLETVRRNLRNVYLVSKCAHKVLAVPTYRQIGAKRRRSSLPCRSNFDLSRSFGRACGSRSRSVRPRITHCRQLPGCQGAAMAAPRRRQAAHRKRQLSANPLRPQNRTSAFPGRHANRRNRNPRMMPCVPGRSSCASARPNRAHARTRGQELLCCFRRAGNQAACKERGAAGFPENNALRRAIAHCGYSA